MQKNSLALSQNFEDYVTSVKTKSENLIKVVFPRKVEELNKHLDSEQFSFEHQQKTLYESLNIPVPDAQAINRALSNNFHNADGEGQNKKRKLNNIHADADANPVEGTKVLVLPSGPVTCNSVISKHIDIVKPYIRELVEHANLLKMWVTFLIPKIEDGNNFGVSIQEDTLGEIRAVEGEAATFYDAIARYHINRGKIISKVAKYPHIDDYRRVVAELDEKEFLSLRIVLSEIRNHYAAMYDLIAKNWEKIIRPRTSNAENLY
ncbi:unnamed protein product [Orchesella dallaii]|uniref:Proteasome activator complex subunit 3 n=1 Tax=Orchesella dallaii TaxID=48710 RepID=A0ABP1Q3E8_9HEXA